MKVLVSACLMGVNCKYNGGNNFNQQVVDFLKDKEVIAVCPEADDGMGVPRDCVEIVNGRITAKDGKDLDEIYRNNVKTAMKVIDRQDIDLAILQSRSPTCGVKQIYDGTFSGKLIPGMGIFAKALQEKGIKLMDAEEFIFNFDLSSNKSVHSQL